MSFDDILIDSFAGGGGASTGIEGALGAPVNIAVNHSPEAIAMHRANHPRTAHYCSDIYEVAPRDVVGSRTVRAMWASPDCTHFSRAKGGQPRSKDIRGLANVVIDWARDVKPRVIFLENVEEFQDWGPLDDDGFPIKARAGEDFRAWLAKLIDLGYRVEWQLLTAADHGAPTTRKRLFLIARCDGRPIVWPTATHGKGRERPWRTASEIIDWSLPCPSIFGRKKPLADATLRRIAAGLRRFVIESGRPFVVALTHHGRERVYDLGNPLPTITAANRGELAFVTPFLSSQYGASVGREASAPVPTVTAGYGGHQAIVTPFIAPVTHTTSGDRVHRADEPLKTVTTAKGGEFVLAAPTLVQTGYGEREGQRPRVLDLDAPLGTVVAGGQKHALAAAFLTKFYGTSQHGADIQMPLPTVTATGQHVAEVRAFLVKYYGSDGNVESQQQDLFAPLHTVTTKARFGLVTLGGEEYQIADIGMRMLAPHELFAAQGFPEDYKINVEFNGKPLTKTAQIELAGNSVCPPVARAIVAANLFERSDP